MGRSTQTEAAATLLRRLLTQRGAYRRAWQREAGLLHDDRINHSAVARVLAKHLWQEGEAEGDYLARDLKDRVARALAGQVLSPRTLRLFIEAFHIADEDAQLLWFYLTGSPDEHAIQGPVVASATRPDSVPKAKHETLTMHDLCRVTEGGTFLLRVIQVIRALHDNVHRVPFRFEGDLKAIDVHRGGSPGWPRRVNDLLTGVDILLARKLRRGETAALEYSAEIVPDSLRACQYRRTIFGRVENATMILQFDGARVPRQISWAVWSDPFDQPIQERDLSRDRPNSVHRHLTSVEHAGYGFRWEW
ncbi:hypothetical protein [Flindersiella endophytica]